MKNKCAISYDPFLGRKFNGNNYLAIANMFLDNQTEGYFYGVEETADRIKLFLEKKGTNLPFSQKKFINTVINTMNKRKIYSYNKYFSKDISELYGDANDALAYMTNTLEQKLIRLSFIDTDKKTITLDNSSLNGNIQEYKNDLFKQIFEYVKLNYPNEYKEVEFKPLYINKRFNLESNYKKIISDLSDIFISNKYNIGDFSINKAKDIEIVDIFNAGVILANFDTLIESKFNNIISVNQLNFGAFNNPINTFHYFLEFKGIKTEFWKGDSHEQESVENYSSNFMKVLSSTIPLLDSDGLPIHNRYLGMNGIYLTGALIKQMNKSSDIVNFQENPKKNLKQFLNILRKEGKITYRNKINSLYKYLYDFKNGVVPIIDREKELNPNIISSIVDIEAIVAHQLNNIVVPTYSIYSTTGQKRLINLVERDLQGDETRMDILNNIIQNKNLFDSVNVDKDKVIVNTTNGNILINEISSNLDKHTRKVLKDLTGINITNNFKKTLEYTLSGQRDKDKVLGESFAALLKASKEIINEIGASPKIDYAKLLPYLNNTKIVDIIDALLGDLSPEALMTFKNITGNSIPTLKQSNIAHERKTVTSLAKSNFKDLSSNVLFLKHPNLYVGTETVLEVETGEDKSVSALYINPEENFKMALVDNYIKPMLLSEEEVKDKKSYLSFKLVNYSDKSTILNELIDQDYPFYENYSLRTISLENLKKEHKKYINSYYSNLIKKILLNYSNLIYYENGEVKKYLPDLNKNTISEAVDRINVFLSNNGKDLNNIILNSWTYVENEKKLGNIPKDFNLEFTDEVTYSKYSNGYAFNNNILLYYYGSLASTTSKYPDIINLSEELFVNKLLEISPDINPSNIFDNNSVSKVLNLYKNLNLDITDWVIFNDSSKKVSDIVYFTYTDSQGNTISVNKDKLNSNLLNVKKENIKLNPLIAKWLHTQNLIRYNSLAITTKHEYQHPHKTDLNSNNTDFIKEMTGRSISMTKRMVIHPATMEYYQQGIIEGIPNKIKLATVDDLSSISYNFNGTLKKHDAWDGSLASNPFLSYLLKKSFPAKGISDVQKAIGTSSNDSHSIFLKCALFTINNEMIRKSEGSDVKLDSIMKAMNNIPIDINIDLSRNSINNNLINLNQIAPDGIYQKSGNSIYKTNSLTRLEDGSYDVLYTNVTSPNKEAVIVNKKINNLYDLWQVFGGAYSRSNIDGKYIYSDVSIETVGNLISIIDNGSLKENMIGILAQKSSVKNGATNINTWKNLNSGSPLMYTNFDTNFLGIQLDANHVSDNSVINEISQVISALAQNQSTPELYSELYAAIGEIINNEINNYNKLYKTSTGEFNIKKVSEEFIKVLSKGEQIGNSLEIIKLLTKLATDEIPITLPISNNNFFKGFVINVISKLKSDFIKRKYPGIASVLNPSYGAIQIYEDAEGKTYFHDDILELAEEGDLVDNLNINSSDRNKNIVQNILKRINPNKEITVEEIKPLDVIEITDLKDNIILNDEGQPEKYNLKNIIDYYSVKKLLSERKDIKIWKVNNQPRDLKPVEITFTQQGKELNIFDNDPIRLSWAYKRALDNRLTLSEKDLIILTNFVNFFAQKEGIKVFDIFSESMIGYVQNKLNLWNKRSFELLDLQLNYKQVSEDTNFNDLFGNDDFISKLDLSVFNVTPLEKISGYIHKPAEIIMPKVYRSEFDIKNDSFNKINSQKEEYFKQKLNQIIDPETTNCDIYSTTTSGESIYISVLDNKDINYKIKSGEFIPVNINVKNINGENWRVDIKGQKIYRMPYGASVYDHNGIEIIVFSKDSKEVYYDNIKLFLRNANSQFVYPFASNNKEDLLKYVKISKQFNYFNISNLLFDNLSENNIEENFENKKDNVIQILANSMYSSWQRSNDVVAARIPSQAMQSFMSMKTVGYNEDPGNNVYVSHWQIWLQGSDFDIDKAYIMMFGFKNGIYRGWSPYFKYDNYKNLILSEKLPIPNKNKYVVVDQGGADISKDLIVLDSIKDPIIPLEFIITLLNNVKDFKEITRIDHPRFNELFDIIKNHNSYKYSTNALKNYVVRNIVETSNNPKNQISSYSPIDFGEYENIKKSRENSFTLSLMDGISMDQQQETNAVGKDVIGIAANGIKDYFALIEYFSKYYSGNISKLDNEYFEREFNLTGIEYTKVNRIGGLNLEKKAIEVLNKYIGNQLNIGLDSYRDPSLVLSSLLSASTDNAKELILKAINAGKEFASMHIYLIILGFNEGTVAKFMTSPEILNLLTKFKHNMFSSSQYKSTPDSVVNSIEDPVLSKGPSYILNESDIKLLEFKKIFSLSKELTFLAKILKINQGLDASPEKIYKYFKNIEIEFLSREKEIINNNFEYVKKDLNLNKNTLPANYMLNIILKDKPYLIGFESEINEILDSAKLLNISNGTFSFEKYFSDNEYKKVAIQYYNLIKGTFNILDVVERLPHFKGMIDGAKNSYDQIKAVSKKFSFIIDTVEKIIPDQNLNEKQLIKVYALFDDLIISKWFKNNFKNNLNYVINLKDVEKLTNSSVQYYSEKGIINELKENDLVTIDFTKDVMLANFKLIMENNIIPYLKAKLSENQFISGLITRKKLDKGKSRTWLTTKVRMNRLNDPKNLDLLFNYKKGFNSLIDNKEAIKIGENYFYVADLIFLYNLIVNKDQFGSDRITKLISKYVSNTNFIGKNFYEFYSKIDSGEIELFDDEMPLDSKMIDIIKFAVLNVRGEYKIGKDKDMIVKTLPNPNFTLVTSIIQDAPNYKNNEVFKSLLKYINNNNLLIQFNCE